MRALALLSVVIVAVVVLFSGQNNLQHALAPLVRSPQAALNAHAASPLLSERLTVDQTFHDLYTAARLAVVSDDSAGALKQELAADNPSAKVGRPLSRGGISVRLLDHGKVLELCALTGQGFHCDEQQLSGTGQRYGNGRTLAAARRQARI